MNTSVDPHEPTMNRAEADVDNRRAEDGTLRTAIPNAIFDAAVAPNQARAAISSAPASAR